MQFLSSFNTSHATIPRFLRRNHQPKILPSSSINSSVANLAPDDRKTLLFNIWGLMEHQMDVQEWHLSALDTILSMEVDTGIPRGDIKLFNRTIEVIERWIEQKGWDAETVPRDGKTGLEVQGLRLRNRVYILRGQLVQGGDQRVS